MKKVFILFFSILCHTLVAQNITLVSENENYRFTTAPEEFEYIDFQMDLSDVTGFVAGFRLEIDKNGENNLERTFDRLWTRANKMGANAFSVEEVSFHDEKYTVLVNTYYFDNSLMQENFSFYEDNTIVVFGDLNTKNTEKKKTFKVGKEKIDLYPYQYVKLQNHPDKKLKLSIGGLMGSSVSVQGETDRLGECFSLGGLSIRPEGGGVSVSTGSGGTGVGMGVGINLKTGTIYPMNLNFGLFVMTILDTVQNNQKTPSETPENVTEEDWSF